jgi:hypothetical protein
MTTYNPVYMDKIAIAHLLKLYLWASVKRHMSVLQQPRDWIMDGSGVN